MAEKQPIRVEVPESEIARQATYAIGGYIYQLDHTVMSWLTLDYDELLHVEFAEDIAVSDDSNLDLKQIKKLATNITLRSDGVVKLITSVWDFQKSNPKRRVTGALLTTSGIGMEKMMSFPDKMPGLIYWRIAAREGADVEPIRTALLDLKLREDLHTFISDATVDQLRTRIFRPIQWLAESAGQDELRHDVEEQLVLLGSRMGVPATASKNARDFLVGALLDSIREPAERRYVTKADLLEVFQKKTFITLPPNMLEGIPTSGTGASFAPIEVIARDVSMIPLSRRAAPRSLEVGHLQAKLASMGTLWFHGSSGLGKSTLAMLVARSQYVGWRLVDLRDIPPPAIRSILFGIAISFRQTKARGLILDDIPAEVDNAIISTIGQVARAVASADGVLIMTSMKPPQPTLVGRLGLSDEAVVRVPYLTEKDVADVVNVAGGNPQKWARPIYLFAGGGHPQLVDARVAGLEQRGWNEAEILADVVPMEDVPNDLNEERKAVRSRLLQELRPNATELLLRLSLLHGNFDRPLALIAAETPVAISHAGLDFDFLVGPWIEQVAPQLYRLSPLLKDSGAVGLSQPLQRSIKSRILNYLMAQRPFPAEQLLQVYIIALALNDREALTWFGHAILAASTNLEKAQFKRLAQEVSVFTLFDRDEGTPLIPGDAKLSTLLRFAQLRVAVATDDTKRAAMLVDKALAECSFAAPDQRQLSEAMIYAMVMLEPQIPIRPTRWLSMHLNLIATPTMQPMFAQPLSTKGQFDGLPPTATSDEMLFIVRASALNSVAELAELMDALEKLPRETRDRYLGAAIRTNQSLHLIVVGSWLAEVKRSDFDAHAAAAAYHQLSQTLSAKENRELGIELLCAEAIMLDEYGNDKNGALGALSSAQEANPNDYRLNRQRQKVFYRHKQYAEALEEFEKFKDRMPKEHSIDRAHAMREAGRSAAEIGDLDKARIFFGEAWESARHCGSIMKPMTAGLSADCAILDFDAGNSEGALALMCRALREADDLDPRAGLKQAYVKRVHMAAILYMRGAAPDFPTTRQTRVYGMCSDPEPQEWFRDQPQAQPTFVWYELAELESEISKSHAILDELRRRTTTNGLLPLETTLVSRTINAAIRDLDVDKFMEALKTYPRAVIEGPSYMQQDGFDLFRMPEGKLTPIADDEWNDSKIGESAKNAVLSFLLAGSAEGRADVVTEVQHKLMAVPGLAEIAKSLFSVVEKPTEDRKDICIAISSIVGRLLKQDILDTDDVFMSSIFALQFLEGSVLASTVATALMMFYKQLWSEILENRTFSMRGPRTNGPLILEAIQKGETPMQRMANMALATAAASKHSLSHGLRDQLSMIAAKRPGYNPLPGQ